MKILCLGRRPGRSLLRHFDEAARPVPSVTVIERNRANDTFGWGVVLSDDALGRMQKNDPFRPRRSGRISPIGTISPSSMRASAPCRAAMALPGSAAGRCWFSCRTAPAIWRSICALRPNSRRPKSTGATTTLWWPVTGSILSSAGNMKPRQARHRHAQMQVRLAGHAPEIRRRLHLHLREDRPWLGLGACLPVRPEHRDLHRRMPARHLGPLGFSGHVEGRDRRHLRTDLRAPSGWPRAHVQRRPSARLGGLDAVSPRHLRALVS